MTGELDQSVRSFLAEVAAPSPSCTAGTVSAVTLSAAAGLLSMCTGLLPSGSEADDFAARAETCRVQAMELVSGDGAAYARVLAAQRLPKADPERAGALRAALTVASQPPLRIARLGEQISRLAAELVPRLRRPLRGDAVSAANLAAGAARGAATLVRINLTAAQAPSDDAEAAELSASAAQHHALTALAGA